jgi:hypothetical protein
MREYGWRFMVGVVSVGLFVLDAVLFFTLVR